jgi:hypothetical protein
MLSSAAIAYLFHHVFLPPRLPQSDDYDAEHDLALLDSVIRGLSEFKTYATKQQDGILASAIEMITRLRDHVGNHGDVIEEKLLKNLKDLDNHGKLLY